MRAERAVPRLRFWSLDGVDAEFARELVVRVSRNFAVPCQLAEARPEVVLRWIDGRAQVDARTLLEGLERDADDQESAHIGVIDRDLAIPVFTHVFGLARHHGHAAVISLTRLRPEFYGLPADPEATLRRAVREITHELGHVFGLEHCARFECIMHFAPDVESIDLRGAKFCLYCQGLLPRGVIHA